MPAYIAGGISISRLEFQIVAGISAGGSTSGYATSAPSGEAIGSAPISISNGISLEVCADSYPTASGVFLYLEGDVVSLVKDFVLFVNDSQRNILAPTSTNKWAYDTEYTSARFAPYEFTPYSTYNIVLRKP